MAQLIVRNIEDDIKEKLKALAISHGTSMEEEAREIIRRAVLKQDNNIKLGSSISSRFKGRGLDQDLEEFRGQDARPVDF